MKIFNSQKFLAAYSGVLTLIVTVAMLSGFTDQLGPKFDTISVQRINIVEPDGTIRMVLSNNTRLPGVIQHGKEYPDFGERKASTAAGILFYDAEGSESGGLTFGGRTDEAGQISRFGHFAFDRYEQDQMLTISASDDGTNYVSSINFNQVPSWSIVDYLELRLRIQDLPQEEQDRLIEEFYETHPIDNAGPRALFASVNAPSLPDQNLSTLRFYDRSSTERLRTGLDAQDDPSIELRDANGNVTYTIPPAP